jgi:hypothetical protein
MVTWKTSTEALRPGLKVSRSRCPLFFGREGTDDDLVFAAALAYWAARKMYPRKPAGEEAYWRFKP